MVPYSITLHLTAEEAEVLTLALRHYLGHPSAILGAERRLTARNVLGQVYAQVVTVEEV